MSGNLYQKIEKGAYRISPIGPEWFMRLYALGVIQRNPARAGFEFAPAGTGALPGLHGGDGKDPGSGEATGGCVVCPWPGADVQVRHRYPHLEGSIAGDAGSAFPGCVYGVPVSIEDGVSRILISTRFCIGKDFISALLRFGIRPRLADAIELLRCSGRVAEGRCDLRGKVAHPGIHPVAGTGFVGKPAMDGQHHLVGCRAVVQRLIFVSEPQELLLSVPLADVNAKGDELLVDHILESVRSRGIGSALDGDCPLVVCIGGGTPRAVLLLDIHSDSAIYADAVVAAGLPGCGQKNPAQGLYAALTHYAVWRDAVNGVRALAGVIRTELGE